MGLFCQALAERGVRVLGIADSPLSSLSPALQGALTDFLYVPDMLDREAMNRALGLLISRHGRIDAIESLNEHWLGIEAQLRLDFNLPGLKPAALAERRLKAGMKRLFDAHGIPCAQGIAPGSAEELRGFVDRVGLPIILKPDQGVGAGGTHKIASEAELAPFLAALPPNYVAEEFLSGTLLSYDGLVDAEGQILFELGTEVNNGVMEIIQSQGPIHYFSLREMPPGHRELGRSILAAFELRSRFFHIELFRLADGSYRALEVNLRPPGGFGPHMMNFSGDFSVMELWARVMTEGQVPALDFEPGYLCAHVGRRDRRRYRHSLAEIRARWGSILVMDRRLAPVFAVAMGDHVFMLRHPEREVIEEAIASIEAEA